MKQLFAFGVRHVAISFFEWRRRHSSDQLYRHIPEEMKVCITAGVARKDIDFKTFGKDYVEFCEANAEDALVYDMDAANCSDVIRRLVRSELSVLPNVVAFPIGDEDPKDLTNDFERIGINATRGKSIPINELKRIQATLYGSNITDPRKLRDGRFAATTTTAWMSPLKYGELWVFVNNRLRHYKPDSLAQAVRAHRAEIEAYGVDPAACASNDHKALTELAVMSLTAMGESLSKRRRDTQKVETAAVSHSEAVEKTEPEEPQLPAGSGQEIAKIGPTEREKVLLPIISVNGQGDGQKVQLTPGGARLCDSCNLSEVCPGYEAESTCKYHVPIEIKTREQWESASQLLLEAQFQRVSHGIFVEQTDGGDLTPRVGQEMDRWFKMLTAIKDLEQIPDPAAGGVMSRFFATPQIGATANADQEDDSTIEGEIVGDEEEDEDPPERAAQ